MRGQKHFTTAYRIFAILICQFAHSVYVRSMRGNSERKFHYHHISGGSGENLARYPQWRRLFSCGWRSVRSLLLCLPVLLSLFTLFSWRGARFARREETPGFLGKAGFSCASRVVYSSDEEEKQEKESERGIFKGRGRPPPHEIPTMILALRGASPRSFLCNYNEEMELLLAKITWKISSESVVVVTNQRRYQRVCCGNVFFILNDICCRKLL